MHDDAPTVQTPRSSTSVDAGRFIPGATVAGRYRIVSPLGRGGMGEVYRADDLKLGQAVALKFLPRAFQAEPARLAMLLDEVKLARQVSHPNVCRVYDVGEWNGQPFLAMEYVDGETLDALLRRIGRIPEDRGVRIARELCAGLAAVHDQGLLHRDLKPSNVMLDGRGRIRLTDFGVAALAGEDGLVRSATGTPAYMAPEQRVRGESSIRSDVYALGLVLYELFTGRSAALLNVADATMGALDPVIEKAILACLAPDPAARPASAQAVARALPGGERADLLLAAHETPSPEMVAAAGGAGALAPWAAVLLVVAALLGFATVLALSERRGLPFRLDDKSYGALRDRAQDLVRALGPTSPNDDVRDGYSLKHGRRAGKEFQDRSTIFYWYRRSPGVVAPHALDLRAPSMFAAPPLETPGEKSLRFDVTGSLMEYRAFPADSDVATGLEPFFRAAGLEGLVRREAAATAILSVPADAESAWTIDGKHVEARTRGGRVTAFVVGEPYAVAPFARGTLALDAFFFVFQIALAVTCWILAVRNLRLGRADLRGASRVALWTMGCGVLGYGLLNTPQMEPHGMMWLLDVAAGVFFGTLAGAGYLALEPIVRRRRPQWLTSWTRLLNGRWLDPRVGRDLILGVVIGILLVLAGTLAQGARLRGGDYQAAAIGGWQAFALVLRGGTALIDSFIFVLTLVLVLTAGRWRWLGWLVWIPLAALYVATSPDPAGIAAGLVRVALLVLVVRVGGLWSVAIAFFLLGLMNDEYLTTHPGAWYGGVTVAVMITVGALLLWGLVAATRKAPQLAN